MAFLENSSISNSEDYRSTLWPEKTASTRLNPKGTSSPTVLPLAQTASKSLEQCDKTRKVETIIQLNRREALEVFPDQFWEVQQGFMKALTWDEQGDVMILGLWGPGEWVGLPLSRIEPYQLLCVTPVQARSIRQQGGYSYEFLWNQAQQTQELLSLFRCRCLENRLLNILWWLANRFGDDVPGGCRTGIPLTHQELADLVGSTRVTITRMLRQLTEAGKLKRLSDRQLILTNSPRYLGLRPLRKMMLNMDSQELSKENLKGARQQCYSSLSGIVNKLKAP